MNLYAESSAVLSWLLGDEAGDECRTLLAAARLVISSDLTLIECDRVLHRAALLGEVSEAEAARTRTLASTAAEHWAMFAIHGEIVERARRAFPREPVRALDAIHLSSALVGRGMVGELLVLSLDERVRGNAAALGFGVLPAH